MSLDDIRATWTPRVLSLLRVVTALVVLQYGTAKLLGFPTLPYLNNVPRFSLVWTAGAIELACGLLLLAGLFTRCAAFVLSGLMAFAYFLYHAPKGFYPLTNGGDLAVLFCFAFLYLAFGRRRRLECRCVAAGPTLTPASLSAGRTPPSARCRPSPPRRGSI